MAVVVDCGLNKSVAVVGVCDVPGENDQNVNLFLVKKKYSQYIYITTNNI